MLTHRPHPPDRRSARLGVAALVVVAIGVFASAVQAQPRPVERVSVRADLAIEEANRRIGADGWTVRHNGPWLYANEQWTNPAGLAFFAAGTEYWILALVEECVQCDFEIRFFDEGANGYFPLNQILDVASDGSLVSASGRFQVEADTRGELYLQMKEGGELYATYMILAQIR